MSDALKERLAPFGAPATGWVDLTAGPTPRAIRYLSLCRHSEATQGLPDAIVEMQQVPIACVIDGSREVDLPALRRRVAMRGDVPYLVVAEPGRITVYEVCLSKEDLQQTRSCAFRAEETAASSVFHRLHVDPWQGKSRKQVHDVLFGLLTDAIDALVEAEVERDNAISLAGRALFIRFLIDRRILNSEDVGRVIPGATSSGDYFRDASSSKATCGWLDRTFNGDFLPLSWEDGREPFSVVQERGFGHLSDILHRAPGGQLRFDWGDLDFAHIPVGVLSQVYERQAERWDAAGKRNQSVYFTPWRIAEYMVQEVFTGMRERGPIAPHQARVLDPSVGGGVFLVAAFQEIVASWWEHHGAAPDTKEIRSILYRQLAGFDISEPALRLAALGLYLKAIELDPDPLPVEKLGFEPLRGVVLHNMRTPEDADGARSVLGSLGSRAGHGHRGAYEVVIGNPPWTSLKQADGRAVHSQMVEAIRPLVAERLGSERASSFAIPDLVPDLPFVWRSLEWAREGGWVAFALHARLLFKTSKAGRHARNDLFEAMTVTGILNGTELRNTEVWPQITAPFCLLFAINEPAPQDHTFYFVSPYLENSVNRQGRMRVDALAAQPVSISRILESPGLLKSLFRGSGLDAAVLEKLEHRQLPTIGSYWESNGLISRQGYQIASRSKDASFLIGRPNLTTQTDFRFVVDTAALPHFEEPGLHRPRPEGLYSSPLLLVRESPPADRHRGRALVSFEDLAFNESFYGFSAKTHPHGKVLVRYLLLTIHSELFLWHLLMTSGKFGVERESVQLQDVRTFPVPPLESLSEGDCRQIGRIFQALISDDPSAFETLDTWAASIYGLDAWDQETIHDTLQVHLPFPEAQSRAQAPPTGAEMSAFVKRLQDGLEPFLGAPLTASCLQNEKNSPWQPILLARGNLTDEATLDLRSIYRLADEQGASQIIAPLARGRLLIATLRQYRYWTPSRARLCVLGLLDQHLDHLVTEE